MMGNKKTSGQLSNIRGNSKGKEIINVIYAGLVTLKLIKDGLTYM